MKSLKKLRFHIYKSRLVWSKEDALSPRRWITGSCYMYPIEYTGVKVKLVKYTNNSNVFNSVFCCKYKYASSDHRQAASKLFPLVCELWKPNFSRPFHVINKTVQALTWRPRFCTFVRESHNSLNWYIAVFCGRHPAWDSL